MKRHILQGLTIMLVCFLIGGSYIIYSIDEATSQLERAITVHQTRDSIEGLQRGIEKNQDVLQQQNIPHTNDLALLQIDISRLIETIENCFSCEYSKEIVAQLSQLQLSNKNYTDQLNNILNLPPDSLEYKSLISSTLQYGGELDFAAESFINNIGGQFASRSNTLYQDIIRVKHLIIFLVIVGPIAILMTTAYFLKSFTGSVETLVQASDVLKSGNLEYRIENKLKYEFKQLADSFNSMSQSLKLQQDELLATRKLYQTLFESAGDGIFILDLAEEREGLIVSANPAAAAMHDYQVEDLSGMNIADVSCDDECPERLQCALDGNWMHYVVERRKKSGQLFLAEVDVGLLDLSEEKYALVFSRDITQKKKEEARLQRANQMVLVGEMAAGLAHEIKNPLAGIKVTLEVLADELDLCGEDQDLFARVINETNRVEKLLKGLLNYARPPQLHYEWFDLNKLLDNSIQNMSIAGKTSSKEGVGFVKRFAVDLPQLEADSAQLQQVILNIFLNAIEAMPEGGEINVSTRRRDEESLEINITDMGKGIPEKVLANIFQPFMTTKSKGNGLGLAISKRIIEEHGGTIEANAPSCGGTEFAIVLPFQRHHREALL